MKDQVQQRKQRWIDFADPSTQVNRLLVANYAEGMPERPMLWWEKMKEREEWAYLRYVRQMEDLDVIPDDKVPFLCMLTGTEIFAEAFGCSVHKPNNNTPFALPRVFSVEDLSKVKKPRLEDTKLVLLFEEADRLKARVGKDALLGLPDIQTPMDIAALIWEKSDFFAAMYEEPEAVHELAYMVREFMFEFFDIWFARYGKEFSAHFPDYYMPYGVSMSEDEIGVVSSQMYREFFEGELWSFSERYGAIGIHSCSDSAHQWKNLRRIPNLKVINLHRKREETLQALDFFRGVCGMYPTGEGERLTDFGDLKQPEEIHVAVNFYGQTREETRRVAEYFKEHGVFPPDQFR